MKPWRLLLLMWLCLCTFPDAQASALEKLGEYKVMFDNSDKKKLQKLFGNDWIKVHQAILELWAKLVLIMKHKDRRAFTRLLIYPTPFHLVHAGDRTISMQFSIKTAEHARRFFPAIFTKNVVENRFNRRVPACAYYVYGKKSASLLSGDFDIYLTIHRIPYKASKGPDYFVTIDAIFIFSDDYFNDKGKVLYEIKHLAAQQAPRSSPQS